MKIQINKYDSEVYKFVKAYLKANEEELLTLWLADKIESTIVEEPTIAYQAMKIANKKLKK